MLRLALLLLLLSCPAQALALSGLVTGGGDGSGLYADSGSGVPGSFPIPDFVPEDSSFEVVFSFPADHAGNGSQFLFGPGDGAWLQLTLYGSPADGRPELATFGADGLEITLGGGQGVPPGSDWISIGATFGDLPTGFSSASLDILASTEGFDLYPLFEVGCITDLACLPFEGTSRADHLDLSALLAGSTAAGEAWGLSCPGDGGCGTPYFYAPVPEPGSGVLLGLGLGSAAAVRRRSRRET